MRYCNLKFVYYKAGVKSTVLQNCIGKKKQTLPNKTTSKMLTNGTENFPNNLYFDTTTP